MIPVSKPSPSTIDPMARALLNSTAAILSLMLMIISFASASDVPNTTIILRPPHSGNNRNTMFLPLYHSPPHAARISFAGVKSRRHLQMNNTQPAIACMPLHDDLILNGYHSTTLYIGTPPRRFSLIVDTGSTITFVPCSTCKHCGSNHEDPKFDPKSSSSYKPVKCATDCLCDKDKVQCIYETQYAEMSSSSGVLVEDIVYFGNQSELAPQRAVFGCENVETGEIFNQQADGIMGLGRGELSIVDQLVDRGVISNSFSLCYGGMDVGGGAMVLGEVPPPADMVFASLSPIRSTHYYIDLQGIHVAGKQISNIFDIVHGTILDSGTTYALLPEALFKKFKDAIIKEMHPFKPVRSRDPSFTDLCFFGSGRVNSQLLESFPKVEMVFGDGQKLLLSPENYMIRAKVKDSKLYGAYCLGIFSHGKDKTILLGGIIVRNTLVMYDREHERIGFWKTNCSEISERLHISNAPPQIPPIWETNSTVAIPPTLAPIGTPAYAPPGELEVGSITFSISMEIKYSNLIDHMAELAQFIAKELNIGTSQVYLLNFSSDGNKSVMRWGIFPAGTADSMSKDAATSIVSRIVENRVHLPKIFGKYQFSEWKFEPPQQWHSIISISSLHRSRSQQHSGGGVVLTFLLILAIGLSALWFLWDRRKRSRIGYRRVSSFVAESELQPL